MNDPKIEEQIAARTAVFEKDVGVWDSEMEIRPAPGAPTARQKGVSTNHLIGGRWLVVDYRADSGFEGHGISVGTLRGGSTRECGWIRCRRRSRARKAPGIPPNAP